MYERAIFINEHYQISSNDEINLDDLKNIIKCNSNVLDSIIFEEDSENKNEYSYIMKLKGRGKFPEKELIQKNYKNIEFKLIKRFSTIGGRNK